MDFTLDGLEGFVWNNALKMVEQKQTIRKMFKFERISKYLFCFEKYYILKSGKFTNIVFKQTNKKKQPSVTLFNKLLILNVLDIFAKLELPDNNKNIDQLS